MKRMTLTLGLLGLLSVTMVYAAGSQNAHKHHEHKAHMTSHNQAGSPRAIKDIDRTLVVTMHDNMRYNLDELQVKAGETIRFQITNKGRIPHEFTIGDRESLLQHRDMMRQMPDMHHEEDNAITLNAGESGELIWTFGSSTNIEVACLLPGHYEAGMKMSVLLH